MTETINSSADLSPVCGTGADSGLVLFPPSYGATQSAIGAGGTGAVPVGRLGLWLGWFAATAVVGLLGLRRRTRCATAPEAGLLSRRCQSSSWRAWTTGAVEAPLRRFLWV
ncbi:hypothetical protein SGFS_035000 [Streptomyces graminofaciens]|uniref:Uncharacterized protein n=1 Tax=Streptomyces graminofaciens TaxID=68212 RepID=A0ABN5VGX6_9ACTN|nr:hypothetical protein SGFS_035000 [Streptomyces graminofaciens]